MGNWLLTYTAEFDELLTRMLEITIILYVFIRALNCYWILYNFTEYTS